jgi:hypothetical protein
MDRGTSQEVMEAAAAEVTKDGRSVRSINKEHVFAMWLSIGFV